MVRKTIATALLLIACAPAAQAAQYVVAEARGVGIAVGTLIDSSTPLNLRQGQHLVLISESGATVKIDGPYTKSPQAENGVQLTAMIGGLITERTARTTELGTTRGAQPKPPLPAPWLIDATSSGSACLQDAQPPVLWRPVAGAATDIVITPADHSWTARATWPANAETLPLDDNLGVHGDASYFVSLDGTESAITITTVPAALTTDQMRAAWMLQKGCDRQVEALLRAAQ